MVSRLALASCFAILLLLATLPTSLHAYKNDLADALIGPGLAIEDMRFELGQLGGRLCNETGGVVDEVSFLFRAYDHRKKEICRRVIDVQGIANHECRGFFDSDKFADYLNVKSWDATPVFFNRVPISALSDLNADLVVSDLRTRNNTLSGQLCHNGKDNLSELFLGVFAVKFKDILLVNARGYIGQLQSGSCVPFTLDLHPRGPIDARQPFLFSLFCLPHQGPHGKSEIVPGLGYEDLTFRRQRLTATLVNTGQKSQANVFIKIYAMGSGNGFVLSQGFFIEKIAPGEKVSIKKKFSDDPRVTGWRFSVVGWE